MDMQNVAKLDIPEGEVRTIHDKDGNLIWGKASYGVKYKGDTAQNGTPTPDTPIPVQTVTGENTLTISDGTNTQSYEVNLGKNLFDVNSITEKTQATTNGVEGHEVTYSAISYRAVTLIKVEPNTTYKLSIGDTSYASRIFFVGMKSTTLESGHSFNWCVNGSTLTTNSKDVYLLGVIEALQGGTISALTNAKIQLERGSQVTSYAAYFAPIELCKIGTYQDYIYKSGGKWYAHKEVGKVTLDGSPDESIVRGGTATSGKVRFNITVSGVANIGGSEVASYSDSFAGVTRNDTWNCVQGVAIGQNLVQIYYEATSGYDLDQFRAWLGSHNTTVYYALATPTDTEITNEALVGQLEAVEQWLTRYGYNATVSGNLPIIIDRTAL